MTKTIALIATSLIVCTVSSGALAVSKRTASTAERDVRELMHLMDTDKNGVVSKDEFMQFMSREFDRLDVDKSGTLERREMRAIRNPDWPLGQCYKRPFPQCSGGE